MKKIIGITGAAVVLLLISLFFASGGPDATPGGSSSEPLTIEEQQELDEQKAAVSPAAREGRYTHPGIGFSFEKPAGYSIGTVPGADGSQTLIVQPAAGDLRRAFQISINSTDEAIELTPNLIKTELPGTSVNNVQAILLDGTAKGIMFASNNEAFGGKSYEIWFSTKTHIYQVTSYGEFAAELQRIIGTWKF